MRYEVEELERNDAGARFRIGFPADSGFFDGHFPGNPILPGVAQVQVCTEVLAASLDEPVRVRELSSVRFRKPLGPGATCELTLSWPDSDGRVDFRLRGNEGPVADGRLLVLLESEVSDG